MDQGASLMHPGRCVTPAVRLFFVNEHLQLLVSTSYSNILCSAQYSSIYILGCSVMADDLPLPSFLGLQCVLFPHNLTFSALNVTNDGKCKYRKLLY